jgi:NDP-sugar pyrophosphorylase family protein
MKHSILLNRAAAPHFNYVGDSILGNDSNLGAGFICSNYRLDGWGVKVYFNGEKIETGLKKCGIILGDGSKLGCNGVSNPGTLLGKRSKSLPCVHFGGVFAGHSLIKGKI